jgi:3'-phosphoadenosine 5'-phosphosulfate sulfotransferase (PAPS reductase)/FAD synthetase
MQSIVSFSGGKDSTAMLLQLIERDSPIDEILFCDTGVEFPAMYDHISDVQKFINRNITIIHPDHDFYWYFSWYKRKSKTCKHPDVTGLGFPGFMFRWCTSYLKIGPINKYCRQYESFQTYIGYSADEEFRTQRPSIKKRKNLIFPLIEWNITGKAALKLCYESGFSWNGLYDHFNRLSCWLCPLQTLVDLKQLYIHFPDYWEQLKGLEKLSLKLVGRSMRTDFSLHQLEVRFNREIYSDNSQISFDFFSPGPGEERKHKMIR